MRRKPFRADGSGSGRSGCRSGRPKCGKPWTRRRQRPNGPRGGGLLFAELSDEVRRSTAEFIWRCLKPRGRSREEFVDLVSRQNILDDEKVAECFEKGKPGISGNFRAGRSVKGH